MADNVVHFGENSPEYIAYKLLQEVMHTEGKTTSRGQLGPGLSNADRNYLLSTYQECLMAVRGVR
jgi:hypothetical protein